MPASRRQTLALAGILAVGAWLRFWTIGDGLPYSVGTDEPVILEKVLVMLQTGDLNPHFFHYGGFVFNFHLAIAAVGYFLGALGRDVASVDQLWAGDLYFWSRAATAALATVTIYLVHCAARRWGQAAALVAALAMAVHPQLVREAHYALTDTPLMFFLALTLLLSIRATESGRLGGFALAGLAAGLAAGTKYNGAVAGLMPFVAVLAAVPASRWAGALAVTIGGSAAGFLVASPYALLDFRNFVDGFTDLARYYTKPLSVVEMADRYRKHLQDWFGLPGQLPRAITWLATLLVLTGFAVIARGLRARATRAVALVLLAFPFVYFLMIANQSLAFARYAMPLVPAISIGLGVGIVGASEWFGRLVPRARAAALAVLLVTLVPPFMTAASLNRDKATIGTIEQASAWITQTIQRTDSVVLETSKHTLRLPRQRFAAREVDRLIDHPLEHYRSDGAVYLIAVSWTSEGYFADPARFAEEVAAYNAIYGSTELVQTFTPSPNHPGPTIRVMRIRRLLKEPSREGTKEPPT